MLYTVYEIMIILRLSQCCVLRNVFLSSSSSYSIFF